MGKYTASKFLTKEQLSELFIDFAKALASIRNPVEAANFIKDLLSEGEVTMLARRLQIARLLEAGLTYEQIQELMKASNTTIAKVHTWMDLYGEGYRVVLNRTKEKDQKQTASPDSWAKLKRKYPMYFWPELLLKEIVKSANRREKERLFKAVKNLKEKTKLSKDLIKILSFGKYSHTQ